MVFAIQACGFTPRCALETTNANDVRILKIIDLIGDCQYGIHDISLADVRFNMPLELGVFIGAILFGDPLHQSKQYIVFEGTAYSSKKYLSDLAGQDPMAHEKSPDKIITCVCKWLTDKTDNPDTIPHPSHFIKEYKRFQKALPAICKKMRRTVRELTFLQYSSLVNAWLATSSK
jgi:hypothetical protein